MKGKYNLLEGEEIRLTVLSGTGWSGAARVLALNAPIVVGECATFLSPGAALRVDTGDGLLLGECRRCERVGGHFKFELKVEHIIPSVPDVAKLMAAVCRATPATRVHEQTIESIAEITTPGAQIG